MTIQPSRVLKGYRSASNTHFQGKVHLMLIAPHRYWSSGGCLGVTTEKSLHINAS